LPDREIVIGFAVFCMTCEIPIRAAGRGDFTGDTNFCSQCNAERETACGITIVSDHKDELARTYEEMRKHMGLVQKVLIKIFGSPGEYE